MYAVNTKLKGEKLRTNTAISILATFFVASAIGAIVYNGIYCAGISNISSELQNFFLGIKENGIAQGGNFSGIYLKYIKYSLFIWLGGFMVYGIALSGVVLCFRGLSLGFTAATLFQTYGFKGMLATILTILPQNLILIPLHLCLMWAAVCFWLKRKSTLKGKANLPREIHKQNTEYGIFFAGAVALTALASFLEAMLIPFLMEGAAMFLA